MRDQACGKCRSLAPTGRSGRIGGGGRKDESLGTALRRAARGFRRRLPEVALSSRGVGAFLRIPTRGRRGRGALGRSLACLRRLGFLRRRRGLTGGTGRPLRNLESGGGRASDMSMELLLPIRGSHFLYTAAEKAVRVDRSTTKSLLGRRQKEWGGLEMRVPAGTHHLCRIG